MPITIGVDIGTTSIAALALDIESGAVLATHAVPNDTEATTPADKARGRSEWDASALARRACQALAGMAEAGQVDLRAAAGLALTGQQHGVVLVDAAGEPLTPFINWQDRRGEDVSPRSGTTYVQEAEERVGAAAAQRTGCRLATGFMGITLYWLRENGALPPDATACFVTDYVGAALTGGRPVTDPTMAASSGLLDLGTRRWYRGMLDALGLPPALFPEVREAGAPLGTLSPAAALATGLPEGLPLFVGLGDNQASFVGSVADPRRSVLVNVGTGAQVAVFTPRLAYAPPLEARPFPGSGYLLVHAGLSGGRSYALLEGFFREVGRQLFGLDAGAPLYERMNTLAAAVPPGAEGLRCDPAFAGTRARPGGRGSWTEVAPSNLTPGHLIRSLLEGTARGLRQGYDGITAAEGTARDVLVGSGNGIRENPVLGQAIVDAFGMPLRVPAHREEAAFGAALAAAVGAGLFPDLAAAARLIRY